MEIFRPDLTPPTPDSTKRIKLTREEVVNKLEVEENLDGFDLADLDLSGLNLERKSFRGTDARGLRLYNLEKKEETNIRNADFTDAIMSSVGNETVFATVQAEGATFGYTETLLARQKRYKQLGEVMPETDNGGYYNFIGNKGNFQKTKWINIHFGGGSDNEASFMDTDLTDAIIEAGDLSNFDLSQTKIDNIKIKDPVAISGLRINEEQTDTLAQAFELSNQEAAEEFRQLIERNGPRKALEEFFEIVIIEPVSEDL
jgi:uncharacterized protein YjbI with pentapeptide repeats